MFLAVRVFGSNGADNQKPVEVEISPGAFKDVLKFVYGGDVSLRGSRVLEICMVKLLDFLNQDSLFRA